jgi:predicted TIM-barrel fold metal-dependent hydrolase
VNTERGDLRLIDAHHHIWPQADLPWLNGPMQPRIFGPYESIMRDYPLGEFRQDTARAGVVASVYVQANWATERFEDEVAWVQSIADDQGLIRGIVGYADFTTDDVRPQLDRLSAYPLMRGVRQQLHWHENPLYRFASQPDLARNRAVQKNVAHLAEYGWSFDLQVFDQQMPGARELADSAPDVTFILQHAGMLEDTSDEGRQRWLANLRVLAEAPNVVTKLSAFGTFIHRNDPSHIARMITDAVSVFGAERCLFGSNFPIEKIWTDYDALAQAFIDATDSLGGVAQQQIFFDNAARVYRLAIDQRS